MRTLDLVLTVLSQGALPAVSFAQVDFIQDSVEQEALLPRAPTGDRAYLGIQATEGNAERVEVAAVVAGGPAASAGLRAHDVILSLGDRRIRDLDSLSAALQSCSPGQTVVVGALRGESRSTFSVVLGRRAVESAEEESEQSEDGGLQELRDRLQQAMEARDADAGYLGVGLELVAQGAVLSSLTPAGPAERAGLRVGDRILAVGDRRMGDAADLVQAIAASRPGDTVELSVRHRGSKDVERVRVELGRRSPTPALEDAARDAAESQRNLSEMADRTRMEADRIGAESEALGRAAESAQRAADEARLRAEESRARLRQMTERVRDPALRGSPAESSELRRLQERLEQQARMLEELQEIVRNQGTAIERLTAVLRRLQPDRSEDR